MAITHNLGFPRIGKKRELKFALEKYWAGKSSETELEEESARLRKENLRLQAGLDFVPVGDFSLYDHILDTSVMVGNLRARTSGADLNDYFRLARGRAPGDAESSCARAAEMTKWFDTNYHYLVPELQEYQSFRLNAEKILREVDEAQRAGLHAKPVIVGPVSYLWLGKSPEGVRRWELLPALLPVYRELLGQLAERGVEWVQIDEPALVMELDDDWKKAFSVAYETLSYAGPRLLLATYFGRLKENLELACGLPVHGLHVDMIRGRHDWNALNRLLPETSILSLGVVDGRNIWRTNLEETLDWLEPIAKQRGDRLWIAPSCSLLHVPVDLDLEDELDEELKSWLSFAVQRLEEVALIGKALNDGRAAVADELEENRRALQGRRESPRTFNPQVRNRTAAISGEMKRRPTGYSERAPQQKSKLNLPLLPTTTIGSFPQTADIRRARRHHRAGTLSDSEYQATMESEVARVVEQQEALGLDVLVHGEPERNDMVEYFGERLDGYAFTRFAWVQSYGSRCVKPPLLFGDVSRPEPMTVKWATYAQSLTTRPMKGMLTGPVTILNWSFVRDDLPRKDVCAQLALAIRDEVVDLEAAGIKLIQIDEAALREGLPLRRSEWDGYLDWAVDSFRLASSGVRDDTQIHTHMCYSEFNDIIESIARLDADVITIETSRSDGELLRAFDDFKYPNEIGPGVYDIHSPNTPPVEKVVDLLKSASATIPIERLWVNPDCGLKTRKWEEVVPALRNMVEAANRLRGEWSVAAE